METILIQCPHCHEKMQAPKDRDEIICMFCGKTISMKELLEGKQEQDGKILDTAKCFENLNFVLYGAEKIFNDYRNRVRSFKKDSYAELFESYKEENYAFFTALKICLTNLAQENAEGVYHQIAKALIDQNQAELDTIAKKNDKFAVQMDKNMFMAIYVLPAIKEIHMDMADDLAEQICTEWSSAFKDSKILASDFDSISAGFHRKLCYVTTAVCQNMHKGLECEELRLIKGFRDQYLAGTSEGRDMIDAYYDIAPTIVKRIDKSEHSDDVYAFLWNNYIKPCVDNIKAGDNENCKTVYCDMVNNLKKEYMENPEQRDR